MLPAFKFLIRQYSEGHVRLDNRIWQVTGRHSCQQVVQAVTELFGGSKCITQVTLRKLLVDHGQYYENSELRLFFRTYFDTEEVTPLRVAEVLVKGSSAWTRTQQRSVVSFKHNIVALINQMMKTTISIDKLKKQFRMEFEAKDLFQQISEKGKVTSSQLLRATRLRKESIGALLALIQQGKLVMLQDLRLFLGDQSEQKVVDKVYLTAEMEVQKQVRLASVANYMRGCIEESRRTEGLKQKVILDSNLTYESVYLLFGSTLSKSTSFQQSLGRLSEFDSDFSKNGLRQVFFRFGDTSSIDLESVRRWMTPKDQAYRTVLQRRAFGNLKPAELKQIVTLVNQMLESQTRLLEMQSGYTSLSEIFGQIDTNHNEKLSIHDLAKFLAKHKIRSDHKDLISLMFRFTRDYESTYISYSDFVGELSEK